MSSGIDAASGQLAPNARNPWILAEFAAGQPIDWGDVPDERGLLEELLGVPYNELFDPRFESPVFLGTSLNEEGHLRRVPVRAPTPEPDQRDSERAENRMVPRVVSDLEPIVGSFESVRIRRYAPTRFGGWTLELAPTWGAARFVADAYKNGLLGSLVDLEQFEPGWTPSGAEWSDTGAFFKEAAEYFDPVQGAIGDCGLIAALSSVARVDPYNFAHRSRATGNSEQQFRNQFTFANLQTGGSDVVEMTERVPVWAGTATPLYARSSEEGETWPSQLEKAFAIWRSGRDWDRPNMIAELDGTVWPDVATAELTGRQPRRTTLTGITANQLKTLVKSHCVNGRAVDPMTTWTYVTAPVGVSYADANIVANHAYSVLGWTQGATLHWIRFTSGKLQNVAPISVSKHPIEFNQDFAILRNPWGRSEPAAELSNNVISLRDIGFTRSIDLSVNDGLFAIDFPTFQSHFGWLGVAV